MIDEILKNLPLICFTTIIIIEILCGFSYDMIGSAVFGLFILILFGVL